MNIEMALSLPFSPAAPLAAASALAAATPADAAIAHAPVFSLSLAAAALPSVTAATPTSTPAALPMPAPAPAPGLTPAAAPTANEHALSASALKAAEPGAAKVKDAAPNPAESLLALLATLGRGSEATPAPAPAELTEVPELPPATTNAADAPATAATPDLSALLAVPLPAPQLSPPPAPPAMDKGPAPDRPGTPAPALTVERTALPVVAADPAMTVPPATDPAASAGLAADAPPAEFKLELPAALTALRLPEPPAAAAAAASATPAATGVLAQAQTVDDFTEQVVWHLGRGLQEARIQLHPQDLGTVDIQLQLKDDRASLVFTVEQPQARAAVQAALPQLAQMLANQGLQLADAQVQSQHRGHQGQPGHPDAHTPPAFANAGDPGDDETATTPLPAVRQRVGLVDQYA